VHKKPAGKSSQTNKKPGPKAKAKSHPKAKVKPQPKAQPKVKPGQKKWWVETRTRGDGLQKDRYYHSPDGRVYRMRWEALAAGYDGK
ncbi:unnamed protein product, partial [Symbiodinium pilosum]